MTQFAIRETTQQVLLPKVISNNGHMYFDTIEFSLNFSIVPLIIFDAFLIICGVATFILDLNKKLQLFTPRNEAYYEHAGDCSF